MNPALLKDYDLVFGSDAGQRVLADLDYEGFITRQMVVAGGPVDPTRLAVSVGANYIVQRIHGMLDEARKPRKPAEDIRAVSSTVEG